MFRVLPEAFDLANGLLTPSMKLRRDAITQRFAAEIEAMYQTSSRVPREYASSDSSIWEDSDNVFR